MQNANAKPETAPTFITVAQWRRDEPDGETPRCPSCGTPLGIREAWMNASGRDEWECDQGCNGNGY